MWTIWRSVVKEHVAPFIFAFVIIFFILVLDLLIDIMDAILGKGLEATTVVELFVLNFAWMVALAVPMAVLVSVLMAFGRLANDNEVVALMAAGISPASLVFPSLVASVVVALALIWFNNNVLPESNYRARVLTGAVQQRKPAISLKDREGTFITDFPGYTLRIDRVRLDSSSPTGPITGSRLEGILVYEYDEAGREPPTVVTARTGTIEIWKNGAVVRLVLHDGEMIQVDSKDPTRDLRTDFDTQTIIITDRQRERTGRPPQWSESGQRSDRELSAADMLTRVTLYHKQIEATSKRIEELRTDTSLAEALVRAQTEAELRLRSNYVHYADEYMVEVHKKYSIPVACLVFVLVGAPLGMMARGAGRTVAILASLTLFLLYWASLIGGEQLADRDIVPPWVAMWGANIVVGLCGLALLVSVDLNVRMASLLEALPRALEARRLRRARRSARQPE